MKKFLALILVLALSLTLLAGCGGGNNGGGGNNVDPGPDASSAPSVNLDDQGGQIGTGDVTGTGKQELTIAIASDIGSFYPGGAGQAPVKVKRVMCYETLFFKDENGELHPCWPRATNPRATALTSSSCSTTSRTTKATT